MDFQDAVRARINDGSYTDRYIAQTDEGVLYLTDTGSTENKISTDIPEDYDLDEVIEFYRPRAPQED